MTRKRRYAEVEAPVADEEENEIVSQWNSPSWNTRRIAVSKLDLAVSNAVIYVTRAGKRYFEHKQLESQNNNPKASPDCRCHERTYLSPHNNYWTCNICKDIHYVKCVESLIVPEEIELASFILCRACHIDYIISKKKYFQDKEPHTDNQNGGCALV